MAEVNCIKLPYLGVTPSEAGGECHLGTRGQFTEEKLGKMASDSTSCHKANRQFIVAEDYKGLHAPQKKN